MAERTAELERSNRELDQFAYIASHDLRSPLRATDILAGWITEDAAAVLPEASLEHLAKLRGRIRRMDTLLSDLLDYSRAGRQHHAPELVDTSTLIRGILDLLAPPPGFKVNVIQPLPVMVAERIPLETVFRNLIGNAIKHYHEHPATGQVNICAKDSGPFVEFAVADNGPGIDPIFHERIFEIFQTLQPATKSKAAALVYRLLSASSKAVAEPLPLNHVSAKEPSFALPGPKRLPSERHAGASVAYTTRYTGAPVTSKTLPFSIPNYCATPLLLPDRPRSVSKTHLDCVALH